MIWNYFLQIDSSLFGWIDKLFLSLHDYTVQNTEYWELDQFSFIMGAQLIKVAMKPNLT